MLLAKFIYQWKPTQHGRRLFRVPAASKSPRPVTATIAAPVATIEAGEAETETRDYAPLLKSDLVDMAEERGLDSSGTKADIIARLEDDDDDAA